MKKLFLPLLLLLGAPLWAGTPITRSFEFLRTDFYPRTVATGGAFVTFSGDVGTLLFNPAGMALSTKQHYAFALNKYLLDINGGLAAYTRRVEGLGVVSALVSYMNYGEFKETNTFARETGNTFSANDVSFNVSLSDMLGEGLSYGVTLKYIFSQIESYNASSVALDFGLLWQVPYDEGIRLGFAVTNLGSNFEYYGSVQERLPLDMRLGFSKKLAHLPLTIALSLIHLADPVDNFSEYFKRFAVGGEFTLSEILRFRLGYDHALNRDLNDELRGTRFGGVSGGLGLYYKNFRFDYAYSDYDLLGGTHRLSLTGTLD